MRPLRCKTLQLAISGQALRIADAHAGAGLVMSGGIASVNTATAQGTGITSDVVAVVPSGSGGLELSASGVKVKTPTNSGLVVDSLRRGVRHAGHAIGHVHKYR
jgi:hypothetical protein